MGSGGTAIINDGYQGIGILGYTTMENGCAPECCILA